MNCLVTKVLTHKGMSMRITDFLAAVYNLVSTELFPNQIAAGCLGGAVNGGFCIIANGMVTRIK